MTRLTLLRHAKSSWDQPDLSDIDRTLNDRGRRDAPLMGLVCAERLPKPDIILVSPAVRTMETVELFADAWNLQPGVEVIVEDRLYLATRFDWIRIVGTYAGRGSHILGCGHQPGVGNFAGWLDGTFNGDVPTATVLSFLTGNGGLDQGTARLDFAGRPKDYRK
jgi:phosphohistidine phosphatase